MTTYRLFPQSRSQKASSTRLGCTANGHRWSPTASGTVEYCRACHLGRRVVQEA